MVVHCSVKLSYRLDHSSRLVSKQYGGFPLIRKRKGGGGGQTVDEVLESLGLSVNLFSLLSARFIRSDTSSA